MWLRRRFSILQNVFIFNGPAIYLGLCSMCSIWYLVTWPHLNILIEILFFYAFSAICCGCDLSLNSGCILVSFIFGIRFNLKVPAAVGKCILQQNNIQTYMPFVFSWFSNTSVPICKYGYLNNIGYLKINPFVLWQYHKCILYIPNSKFRPKTMRHTASSVKSVQCF